MFGWSHSERAAALEDARRRIATLEAAYAALVRENAELHEQRNQAEEQAAKFRLDFLEAVRRASRLERRVAELEKRRSRIDQVEASTMSEPGSISETGTMSESDGEVPRLRMSSVSEDGETDLDIRPWELRRRT